MENDQKVEQPTKPDEAPSVLVEDFLKISFPETEEIIFEGRA